MNNDIEERILLNQGKILTELNKKKESLNINDYEFKIFSQWGEDGIVQYLIDKIEIKNEVFVEFGVENYQESNTRFLLKNNNWSGLVIDGNKENVEFIKNDDIYWKYSLKAVCEFITKDNINNIISNSGISGDIGLLSIDIDGNDYWVFEAINIINPRIIIVEYNSIFGKKAEISVPYDEEFNRTEKHYSNLYWGASIKAFTNLANKKGYSLVGSNSAGCNLFFVRGDLMKKVKEVSIENAYFESKFRQSRDENGNLSFLNNEDGLKVIKSMEVLDITNDKIMALGDLKLK